jgi:hypothetical protein
LKSEKEKDLVMKARKQVKESKMSRTCTSPFEGKGRCLEKVDFAVFS